jgi:RNA polymerase sigma-70 factor (ECF subfamily)
MDDIFDAAIPDRCHAGEETGESSQENVWVTASQRGDVLAFNRLVLKWEKNIYNLSLRLLRDPNEAAEATQEVFLTAFKAIRKFRRDAAFSTWIYRITVNHCINRLQRRPENIFYSLDSDEGNQTVLNNFSSKESQEDDLIQRETRRRVRNALEFLSPRERIVLELRFYQDLKFEEISDILRMPISTVKSRFYSGLEMLRVRLRQ